MLAADIVIAAEDFRRFGQIEVRRGIMASGGATIRMVERAGWGDAMRYLLTGDEWDAETALRFNFVQEVVATGTEFERARELASRIAERAPRRWLSPPPAPMRAPRRLTARRRRSPTSVACASACAIARTPPRAC